MNGNYILCELQASVKTIQPEALNQYPNGKVQNKTNTYKENRILQHILFFGCNDFINDVYAQQYDYN